MGTLVPRGYGGAGLGGAHPLPLRFQHVEYCIMVIGVPNVGKSSLINSLRRQHLRKGTSAVGGAGTGSRAGTTLQSLRPQLTEGAVGTRRPS